MVILFWTNSRWIFHLSLGQSLTTTAWSTCHTFHPKFLKSQVEYLVPPLVDTLSPASLLELSQGIRTPNVPPILDILGSVADIVKAPVGIIFYNSELKLLKLIVLPIIFTARLPLTSVQDHYWTISCNFFTVVSMSSVCNRTFLPVQCL